MLKGALTVQIAGEEHTLDRGDSIYFDPSQSHSYAASGPGSCEAIVVTTR